MTSIDTGLRGIKSALSRIGGAYGRFGSFMNARLPKGLYARTLLILLIPIVLLQSVLTYVFLERHWNLVTQRLSAAVSRDIEQRPSKRAPSSMTSDGVSSSA